MPSRIRTISLAGLVLILILMQAPVAGQERPEETFVEELEVVEVLLDVLVTDRQDQVIIGLGKDDFLVEEGGEPVEVTGLTFYSSRELWGPKEPLEREGLEVDEIAEDRYFILLFQQQRRAAADVPGIMGRLQEATRAAERWIVEDLHSRDMVAVATFETRLVLLQDFTNKIDLLRDAMVLATKGHSAKDDWPSRRTEPGPGPALAANLPEGKALGKATRDIYEALQVLARAAGPIRGRKNLLFFGRGIGEMGPSGFWEPDSRFYDTTMETLNDNNVAVYPLNLMPSGSRHTLEESLYAMAFETGGTYNRQATSFTTPLKKISAENGGYYLLSYRSSRPPDSAGFQKVRVSARNKELVVRARKGYLYGDDESRD